MLDFFNMVGGYLVTLWNMVLNLIESLLMAVGMVASSVGFVTQLVAYVPPILASGIIIFIAVFVVRFLLMK